MKTVFLRVVTIVGTWGVILMGSVTETAWSEPQNCPTGATVLYT
jgi:hypothetical protein